MSTSLDCFRGAPAVTHPTQSVTWGCRQRFVLVNLSCVTWCDRVWQVGDKVWQVGDKVSLTRWQGSVKVRQGGAIRSFPLRNVIFLLSHTMIITWTSEKVVLWLISSLWACIFLHLFVPRFSTFTLQMPCEAENVNIPVPLGLAYRPETHSCDWPDLLTGAHFKLYPRLKRLAQALGAFANYGLDAQIWHPQVALDYMINIQQTKSPQTSHQNTIIVTTFRPAPPVTYKDRTKQRSDVHESWLNISDLGCDPAARLQDAFTCPLMTGFLWLLHLCSSWPWCLFVTNINHCRLSSQELFLEFDFQFYLFL